MILLRIKRSTDIKSKFVKVDPKTRVIDIKKRVIKLLGTPDVSIHVLKDLETNKEIDEGTRLVDLAYCKSEWQLRDFLKAFD